MRVINVSQYVDTLYKNRLEGVVEREREFGYITTVQELQEMTPSCERYLEVVGQFLKSRDTNWLESVATWAPWDIVDNYGIVILGPETASDFFAQVDSELQAASNVRQHFPLIGNLGQGQINIGLKPLKPKVLAWYPNVEELHEGRGCIIVPVVQRGFSIPYLPKFSKEYAEERRESCTFYLQKIRALPNNMVTISTHGNRLGVARAIHTMGEYVKQNGYFAHFNEFVKPSPHFPGVLYIPSSK